MRVSSSIGVNLWPFARVSDCGLILVSQLQRAVLATPYIYVAFIINLTFFPFHAVMVI
jgi:hypothetical protein